MQERADPEVIVAGHLCLDIIPQIPARAEALDALPRPGRLSAVGPAALATGGAVSNTGLALHRLGIATRLIGKVGDDLFGKMIERIVAAEGEGLAGDLVLDSSAASAYTVVISIPGVDRIFLHHSGVNDNFTADDVRLDLVARARMLHFGYPPLIRAMYEEGGRELAILFRRARSAGCTTSLDMSLPDPSSAAGSADWAAILQAVLPTVDVFAPSIDELLYMLRRELYDRAQAEGGSAVSPVVLSDLAGELLQWGAKIVLIKLGDKGAYLRTADHAALTTMGRGGPADPDSWAGRELWAPCFRVVVAGTTGAGDATIAGFLAALLRGLGPEDALTTAVAVGACNVEAVDALSGVRTWDETQARIAAGWPRHALPFESIWRGSAAAGWRYDAQRALWVGLRDGRWQ